MADSTSTAEVLRDRESGGGNAAPVATEAAPTGAPPSGLSSVAELALSDKAFGNYLLANDQLATQAKKRADTLGPRVEEVKQQGAQLAQQAAQSVPPAPILPEAPKRDIQNFLTSRPGESAEASVAKFLSAVTLFATGTAGLVRGDARSSLAALTGALQGWKQGDDDWAQRQYEDWKNQTDRLIAQHKMLREQWEEWFRASKLNLDQKLEGLQLDILKSGFDLAPFEIEARGAEGLLKFIESRRQAEAQLQLSRDRIVESRERHLSDQDLKRQLADEARETKIALASQAASDRMALRELMAEDRREQKRGEAYKHEVWDKTRGDVVTVTRGEREDDLARAAAGQPTRFKDMSSQEKQQVDRLALAPSIIQKLDVLIDRIMAEHPGENLTQGLINRMRKKMSGDIAVFEELNKDLSVELAAALSGGQPRISILAMIQGTAPDLSFTKETAHAQTAAAYTTIANRLTRLTGDPEAVKHVSKDFREYGDTGRVLVRDKSGQRWLVPANTDFTKYPNLTRENP